jgi:hypothetical protein
MPAKFGHKKSKAAEMKLSKMTIGHGLSEDATRTTGQWKAAAREIK